MRRRRLLQSRRARLQVLALASCAAVSPVCVLANAFDPEAAIWNAIKGSSSIFPMARIKKIIKADPDVKTVNKDANTLIAKTAVSELRVIVPAKQALLRSPALQELIVMKLADSALQVSPCSNVRSDTIRHALVNCRLRSETSARLSTIVMCAQPCSRMRSLSFWRVRAMYPGRSLRLRSTAGTIKPGVAESKLKTKTPSAINVPTDAASVGEVSRLHPAGCDALSTCLRCAEASSA